MRRYAIASLFLAACTHHAIDGASSSAGESVGAAPLLAPASPGAAWSTQTTPAAASDGTNFLVVWAETPAVSMGTGPSVLRATRIDETGKLLDATSIALPSTTGDDTEPSIVFDGHAYALAWLHTENKVMTIRAAHIGTDGKVVETAPIELGPGDFPAPAIANDGAKTLVVWANGPALLGSYLDAPKAFHIADPSTAHVAAAGLKGTFLVAFDTGGTARLDDAGNVLDSTPSSIADNAIAPHIATDGKDFLVTWTSSVETSSCHVDPTTGTHSDSLEASAAALEIGALVYDGADYVISTRLGGLSRGLDTNVPITGGDATNGLYYRENQPALASNGRVTLAVDAYFDSGDRRWAHESVIASLTASGGTTATLMTQELAQSAAGAQRSPALAHGPNASLSVWIEDRTSFLAPIIRGAWIDANGAWLGQPIDLQTVSESDTVSVVWNGTAFDVSWTDEHDLDTHMIAVTPESIGAPTTYLGAEGSFAIANGHTYVLASGFFATDDPKMTIPTRTAPTGAQLVWNGKELVAAWTSGRAVYIQRFSTGGQAIDAAPVMLTELAAEDMPLAITSDGAGTTFFAWNGFSSGPEISRLDHGAVRVSASVTAPTLSPTLLSSEVKLAFDGAHVVAAYVAFDGITQVATEIDALALDPATLAVDSKVAAVEHGFATQIGLSAGVPGAMSLTYSAPGPTGTPVTHVQSLGFLR